MQSLKSFLYSHKTLYYSVLLLLCTACSLTVPKSSIYAFEAGVGRKSLTHETANYSYEANGLGNEHKALAFNVQITNNSSDTLLVDPKEWSLLYSATTTKPTQMQKLRSIDPLAVSAMYDELSSKAKTNKGIGTAVGVILIVGLLVLILAVEEATDTCEADCSHCQTSSFISFQSSGSNRGLAPRPSEAFAKTQPSDFKSKSEYFNYKSSQIARQGFGPIVLEKGESRAFKLYFPRVEGMKYLKLLSPHTMTQDGDYDGAWFIHNIIPD